ncbi:MAG TPA: isoprenylcysteine carboxylmethyltransferase family protein [Myxococcota bacterium]|nr:isoprenylcysteine carboxylmethyltransferase family protein [Myxococcota bacterium]HRY97280.1 isoprenylcysteine carboxylmethyltransferase family protein [Myxococcota bacterium]
MLKLLKAENGMNIIGQGARIILFTVPAVVGAVMAQLYVPELVQIPLPGSISIPLGIALLVPGVALWLAAMAQLLLGFSRGKLVTECAYSVCRNPIYSSFVFFILPGISLASGTWVYLAVAGVLGLGVVIFIRKEERDLLRVFGDEYQRYTLRVRRLLPLGPRRANAREESKVPTAGGAKVGESKGR